jgi:hypothetical protein
VVQFVDVESVERECGRWGVGVRRRALDGNELGVLIDLILLREAQWTEPTWDLDCMVNTGV